MQALSCKHLSPYLCLIAWTVAQAAYAAPITVLNHSFEDVSAQSQFNESYFGANTGWTIYQPSIANDDPGNNDIFLGTLNPDVSGPPAATDAGWFTAPTPGGSQVAILFGFGDGRGLNGIDSAGTGV